MLARRAMMRRPVARLGAAAVGTAVVVGTAGVVHHHQQQKYAQQEAAAQQQYNQAYQRGVADAQAQQAAPPPPVQYAAPVEQAPAPDLTAQLQQLAQLHESGVLNDEEFAVAKQKLLAG
jgi:Short C-terminal domain